MACSTLYLFQDGQWTNCAQKSEHSSLCLSGSRRDHSQCPVPSAGVRRAHGGHTREVPPGQLRLGRHRRTIPQWGEAERATGDWENAQGLLLDTVVVNMCNPLYYHDYTCKQNLNGAFYKHSPFPPGGHSSNRCRRADTGHRRCPEPPTTL